MRYIIIWLTGATIAVSTICGCLLSLFPLFNAMLLNGVALLSGIVAYFAAGSSHLPVPFQIASVIFAFLCFGVSGVLALLSQPEWTDNYSIIGILVLTVLQLLLGVALRATSQSVGDVTFPA